MEPHGKMKMGLRGTRDSLEIAGVNYRDTENFPQVKVNSVGGEKEKTSPHGCNFEVCEKDGNNTEADDVSGHGGRGNFTTRR